jgi:hypothetical protein
VKRRVCRVCGPPCGGHRAAIGTIAFVPTHRFGPPRCATFVNVESISTEAETGTTLGMVRFRAMAEHHRQHRLACQIDCDGRKDR